MTTLCRIARALPALLSALALSAPLAAHAQTTYRWIDKSTGQTVYSDQPPPPGIRYSIQGSATRADETSDSADSGAPANAPPAALSPSYAVRQAAAKFPVVLYTSPNCVSECQQARALLNGRGTPFSEKQLISQNDVDQLAARLGGAASVPSLTVGRESYSGFEAPAWHNLLDLAGYPKTAPYGSKPSGTAPP